MERTIMGRLTAGAAGSETDERTEERIHESTGKRTDRAAAPGEAELFLAAHPDLEAVEYIITDSHGVLRGKWAPASSLKKAFTDGINFPVSMYGLDVWGREVMSTGLHV